MRKVSNKRARAQRQAKKLREEYRLEFGSCMVCGRRATDVHEITSGTAGRALSEGEPATWLCVCNHCNCHSLTDKRKWPVAKQAALKLLSDPERFDLEKLNSCYTLGRIHITDVVSWLSLC